MTDILKRSFCSTALQQSDSYYLSKNDLYYLVIIDYGKTYELCPIIVCVEDIEI